MDYFIFYPPLNSLSLIKLLLESNKTALKLKWCYVVVMLWC